MRPVRIILLFSIVLMIGCGPALAAGKATPAEKEVKALLDLHSKLFMAKDLKGVLALYSNSPKVILMGTGVEDRWIGPAEVKKAHEMFFSEFKTETIKYVWHAIVVDGNLAWFAVECGIDMDTGKDKVSFPINWTGVAKKKGGKWKFALCHYSIPLVPPEEEKMAGGEKGKKK